MLFRYGIWMWNDSDDVYEDGVAQLMSAWRDGDMSNTSTPHFAEVNSTHTTNETVFRQLLPDHAVTARKYTQTWWENKDQIYSSAAFLSRHAGWEEGSRVYIAFVLEHPPPNSW